MQWTQSKRKKNIDFYSANGQTRVTMCDGIQYSHMKDKMRIPEIKKVEEEKI